MGISEKRPCTAVFGGQPAVCRGIDACHGLQVIGGPGTTPVAYDQAAGFFVVFQIDRDACRQRVSADGDTVGSEVVVNTTTDGTRAEPSVAAFDSLMLGCRKSRLDAVPSTHRHHRALSQERSQ